MWNLLVVEDETIVRIGLRNMMDWESFGIRWKAEASSGEEALRIIEEEQIHIVITDIRMPVMDGLELAKAIKLKDESVQVIFFSSFDDFSYVQEAVRIGVVDYLHKPTMEEEEIADTLRKAVHNLEELEPAERANPEAGRAQLLRTLLEASPLPDAWESAWQAADLGMLESGFRIVLFRTVGESEGEAKFSRTKLMSVRYFIEEYVAHERGGIVLDRPDNELVWFAPEPLADGGSEPMVEAYVCRMEDALLKLLNVPIAYGYSSVCHRGDEVARAYAEAAASYPVQSGKIGGIVRLAMDYVDAHLLEEISLAKTAESVHVSAGHLSRLFVKEVGESFGEYVTSKKIQYAKRLLRETNRKVYEIAAEIGYTNPHYFSKLFRDMVGVTPLEYRNQREHINK
ncbi:response regulator transcription factor [Cohnella hongkongensis]|uniref:Response regulator n=1 Tax=Cohnella hongkongensis TaxID=178337 RepID=A0ABV9F6R0_9BACL